MNNLYQYNLQKILFALPIEEVKGIVIDSMLPPSIYIDKISNTHKPLHDDMIVENYILSVKSFPKKSTFYNYIIDKAGDVHELISMNYAANCCSFKEYSYNALRLFPKSTSIMDRSVMQSSLTYDQEVLSICTITDDREKTVDTGRMTSECYKSLNNLIEYIICRLTNEYETTINSSNIYLRSMFAMNNYSIGHNFLKKNVAAMLILQRNIRHSVNISRHTTKYKSLFNIVQK